MIPKSELTAFQAVLERLEEIPPLTPLQIFRKKRQRRFSFLNGGTKADAVAHLQKHDRKAAFRPRDKNHPIYGDTHFSLGFQARYLDAQLDDWFAWAHFVITGTPERIKAILKRANMFDERNRFTAAFDAHFKSYWRPAIERKPSGDDRLDMLQSDVPRLNVQVVSINKDEQGEYSFTMEFHCCDCGGFIIEAPDDDDENGPAVCKACGEVFGSMGVVRALAQRVGQLELIRKGLA